MFCWHGVLDLIEHEVREGGRAGLGNRRPVWSKPQTWGTKSAGGGSSRCPELEVWTTHRMLMASSVSIDGMIGAPVDLMVISTYLSARAPPSRVGQRGAIGKRCSTRPRGRRIKKDDGDLDAPEAVLRENRLEDLT